MKAWGDWMGRVGPALVDGGAPFGQRTAGVLGRVQNGSLHLYALLVVLGIVVSLAWSWRHG